MSSRPFVQAKNDGSIRPDLHLHLQRRLPCPSATRLVLADYPYFHLRHPHLPLLGFFEASSLPSAANSAPHPADSQRHPRMPGVSPLLATKGMGASLIMRDGRIVFGPC